MSSQFISYPDSETKGKIFKRGEGEERNGGHEQKKNWEKQRDK